MTEILITTVMKQTHPRNGRMGQKKDNIMTHDQNCTHNEILSKWNCFRRPNRRLDFTHDAMLMCDTQTMHANIKRKCQWITGPDPAKQDLSDVKGKYSSETMWQDIYYVYFFSTWCLGYGAGAQIYSCIHAHFLSGHICPAQTSVLNRCSSWRNCFPF